MFSYDLQSIAKNRETFNRDGKRERRRTGGQSPQIRSRYSRFSRRRTGRGIGAVPGEEACARRGNRSGSPSHEAPPDIPGRKEGSAAACMDSFFFIPFLLFPLLFHAGNRMPRLAEKYSFFTANLRPIHGKNRKIYSDAVSPRRLVSIHCSRVSASSSFSPVTQTPRQKSSQIRP